MVHLFSEMFVLQFSKVEKASTEQVDAAHKQFMAALASLYLKHNTDETISLVITWITLSWLPWFLRHCQTLDCVFIGWNLRIVRLFETNKSRKTLIFALKRIRRLK